MALAADRDRFAAALFAPAPARDRLMALFAFDAEIGRIPQLTREPAAGLIRLAWWRESLAGRRPAESAGHPILLRLQDDRLPAELLERRLDACERALDGEVAADAAAIEARAEASSGTIHELAAILLGADDEASRAAARLVGTAWGLALFIRNRRTLPCPVEALIARAAVLLDEAAGLPFAADALPALLVAVPARIILKRPDARPRPVPLRLAWAAFRKRF